MRALVTGATGFVGRKLLEHLDRPVVLSRNAERAQRSLAQFGPQVVAWNSAVEPAPAHAFDDVDVVFHLAGEPVAEGRWTAAKKVRLRESRVRGTRNLVTQLSNLAHRPRVLVSASAVGYYGDRGDELLNESSSPQHDFLAEICTAWEAEALAAQSLGLRVVCVRVGVVLGPGGGALAKMLTPFKLGLGSALGNGQQWMPWIHRDDIVSLFLFAAENDRVSGPLNGVAPLSVTNREFTKALGRALRRPTFMPAIPGFMMHALFGEFASVLLASQRVVPQAALAAGFQFQFPELELALQNLFPPTRPRP